MVRYFTSSELCFVFCFCTVFVLIELISCITDDFTCSKLPFHCYFGSFCSLLVPHIPFQILLLMLRRRRRRQRRRGGNSKLDWETLMKCDVFFVFVERLVEDEYKGALEGASPNPNPSQRWENSRSKRDAGTIDVPCNWFRLERETTFFNFFYHVFCFL